MKKTLAHHKQLAALLISGAAAGAVAAAPLQAQDAAAAATALAPKPAAKKLEIPPQIWNVPDNNDYTNNSSEFSYARMVESPNIALFWAKEYGADPAANADPAKRFQAEAVLQELERFYGFYVQNLGFVQRGKSVTDKYKVLCYVVGGDDGSAYGGATGPVGTLWTPAVRISGAPYGAVAHELGHSFQAFVAADGAWGFGSSPEGSKMQTIFEMTSQFMLWQVYPEWMTFENYHLDAFLNQTHLAFLHEDNAYHSPFVLEYWASKRGVDFVGKLWRGAQRGEDPVMAYKRLAGLSQAQFNDEIFDASRRFITWDMARIEKVASRYANQHHSTLNAIGDGWYRIAESNCPQNYGYNGIKLKVPAAGTTVTLSFKGIAGAPGFRAIRPERAGWRYGFLAVKEDGSRVYGNAFSSANGTARFVVPAKTKYLWLVVSGAPTEHWEHIADYKNDNDEQWPYQIKLAGTSLDDSAVR